MRYLLLRYGEIFLKGGNVKQFEKRLRENIRQIANIKEIKQLRCRLVIDYFENHRILRQIFGLVSYSPADLVEKDLEKIRQKALGMMASLKGTFKVETQRSDKTFPIKSPEMNVLIGQFIEENSPLRFSRNEPDNILGIEINHHGVYLFTETIDCFGGLPAGIEGKAGLLVEDEASVLAGLLMMKRGCGIVPIGFKKFGIELLQKFSPMKIELKLIKDYAELNQVVQAEKIKMIVSGQNFGHYKKYVFNEIVLRPLIAYSEEEVKKWLEIYDEN